MSLVFNVSTAKCIYVYHLEETVSKSITPLLTSLHETKLPIFLKSIFYNDSCTIFDSLCTIFSYSFFVLHGYSCSIFYKHISQIHINITDYWSIIEIITCLKNND